MQYISGKLTKKPEKKTIIKKKRKPRFLKQNKDK